MSGQNVKKFFTRNAVLITMVPLLVGVHWGWLRMQNNPELVDPKHKSDLPVFTMYEDLKSKIAGYPLQDSSGSGESDKNQ